MENIINDIQQLYANLEQIEVKGRSVPHLNNCLILTERIFKTLQEQQKEGE